MKLPRLTLTLFFAIVPSTVLTGCQKEGVEAFAEEMCACTDMACAEQVGKKYGDLPEMKMKLGEADSLPAEKKAAMEKGMGCSIALQKEQLKSKPSAKGSTGGDDAVKEAAAKAPKLTSHENAAMGYTIDLPEGFATNHEDGMAGMYSFDTLIIKVDPVGVVLKTPDDLLRGVNTDGGQVDKKTEGEVALVVVEKPQLPLNIYAGPLGGKVAAQCMAEPSMRDLALKICTSLRVKK